MKFNNVCDVFFDEHHLNSIEALLLLPYNPLALCSFLQRISPNRSFIEMFFICLFVDENPSK